MKKIVIIGILITLFLIGINKVNSKEFVIPNEAIRLRVVANSNSDIDQKIKYVVTDHMQGKIYELLKNTKGVEEARKIINNNIDYLSSEVEKTLDKEGYPFSYELKYGLNFFPEKTYKGVTYEEGYYESLLVTLGEGKGNNWWCVLFPPLCLMEAEESEEVEYKFFIQELIDKYL